MLENIFLITRKSEQETTAPQTLEISSDPNAFHTIMAYPDEFEDYRTPELIRIIHLNLSEFLEKPIPEEIVDDDFLYANSKAVIFQGRNLLLVPLPHNYILGFVFSLDDNPYDYRNEMIRLLHEYFLNRFIGTKKQKHKTNLLLTLFIDLRKYADEFLIMQEAQPSIAVINNTPMIKAFVYGIDNVGKSSLMRLLATGKFTPDYFPPTKKFRITNIKLGSGVKLICWDMPGQKIFRKDWLRGAQASNIMLFVLDCADTDRFAEAKETLWKMLNMYELQGLPLLFLANKTDLVEFQEDPAGIISSFDLEKCRNRNWTLIFSSLPTSKGIDKLIEWMEAQIEELMVVNGLSYPEK